jgi:hypothetical protein
VIIMMNVRSTQQVIEDALKSRTVLSMVENTINYNPNISLIEKRSENNLGLNIFPAQEYHFRIAPTTPIYSAEGMQVFMKSVIPKDSSYTEHNFSEDTKGGMRFGYLVFDESIGKEKVVKEIKVTDQNIIFDPKLLERGFSNGKKKAEYTQDVVRKIWVNPYPSVLIAQNREKFPYGISAHDLNEVKKLVPSTKAPSSQHRSLWRLGRSGS